MTSKYVEYKKRRLVNLQRRIQELEEEVKLVRAEMSKLYHENVELKSQVYYLESHKKR